MDSSDDSALLFQVCFLIESGNLQGLREYLEKHTNIETVSLPFPALIFDNRQLVPAIHAAVKAKNPAMVKQLYDYDESFIGADDDEYEDEISAPGISWANASAGMNALQYACHIGFARMALILTSLGMNLHSQTSKTHDSSIYKGYSALHIAAFQGHLNLFKTILYYLKNTAELRSYINEQLETNGSFSALPLAFVSDELGNKNPIYDDYGNLIIPEDDAIKLEHKKLAETQLEDPEDFLGDASTTESVDQYNALLNKKTYQGESVLQVAAYNRRPLVVSFIADLAVNTNSAFLQDYQEIAARKHARHHKSASMGATQIDLDSDGDDDSSDGDGEPAESASLHNLSQQIAASNGADSYDYGLHPVALKLSALDQKRKVIQMDLPDSSNMTPAMVAAARGFPEVLSQFCTYNERMEKKGVLPSGVIPKTTVLLPSRGDAGQVTSDLQVKNASAIASTYASMMVDFGRKEKSHSDTLLHLACQSQLHRVFNYNYEMQEDHYACIYDVVTRMPHYVDLEAKNAEGDASLDLLLEPVADLFEALCTISLKARLMGIESLEMSYPTLRTFLDACHDGPHSVRAVPLVAVMGQISPVSTSSLSSSSSSSPPPLEPSQNDVSINAEDLPNVEYVVSLGNKLWQILHAQTERDEARQHSCKLLDTSQIPFTRKFKHYDRNNAASSSSNLPAGHPDLSNFQDGATCPMGFGKKSTGVFATGSTTGAPPAGHPDISKYPESATCPMGFGRKKSATQVTEPAPQALEQPPAGHPDISKYPPGATCPMGFGKKKAAADLQSSSSSSTPAPTAAPTAAPTTVSDAKPSTLASLLSFESMVLIGAAGALASLAALRLFQHFSPASSSSSFH